MTARIGSIERKTASYDVWNLGEDVGGEVVGGEELKALSCLLPRSKKHGKLYLGTHTQLLSSVNTFEYLL